jgi:hypothetical protein
MLPGSVVRLPRPVGREYIPPWYKLRLNVGNPMSFA